MGKRIVLMLSFLFVVNFFLSCYVDTARDNPYDPEYTGSSPYPIGSTGPGGGIVFYDKGSYSIDTAGVSWRYLEVASVDQNTGIIWTTSAYQGTSIGTTAQGTAIGTGRTNTNAIVAQAGTGTTYAAGICDTYTGGGYSDWFLPSKDELSLIYTNLEANGIGGFTGNYWSSSEIYILGVYGAWTQSFVDGHQANYAKHFTLSVRAIRAY